jgi:hypothetical protein
MFEFLFIGIDLVKILRWLVGCQSVGMPSVSSQLSPPLADG